jgi:hypothetical protein
MSVRMENSLSSMSSERALFVIARDDDAALMGGSFLACAERGACSVLPRLIFGGPERILAKHL